MSKLKEIIVKIDEKSLEAIAETISIRRAVGHFYGPCDTLAFILGVSIENGKSEVEITDIKNLSNNLSDELNAKWPYKEL